MFRRKELRSSNLAALLGVSFVLVSFVLVPSAAFADSFTVVTRLSAGADEPVVATHYFSPTQLRTAEDRLEVIVDLESGVMTHVDHRHRQYFTTSATEVADHFADVEILSRSHPILKRLLADATTVEVGESEGERQVAGQTCQERTLELGPEFEIEACTSLQLPVPDAFYDARKLLWANIGPMAILFAKSFEAMKEIDGFPLRFDVESTVPGLEMSTRRRVLEIEPGAPADAFVVPAGYEEIRSPYE